MAEGLLTLFLCGDVMPGRGVDQILPHPGDPDLREGFVDDARAYVRLAERANGPIPRPVSFSWHGATPCTCLTTWHPMSG
jgi:poly-gamma-glutamate capsule biosynthesis protein CapA/YwtB (metallophosphatase superfamily)